MRGHFVYFKFETKWDTQHSRGMGHWLWTMVHFHVESKASPVFFHALPFLSCFYFYFYLSSDFRGLAGEKGIRQQLKTRGNLTQMLLLEARKNGALEAETVDSTACDGTFYILLLPVLDGDFRASLQGNSANELQLCVESGDPDVQTSEVREALFVNSGDKPYELMRDSIKILAEHKGTFCHVENKKIPANLDWFGWCTWDAFYTAVNPQGIMEGLQRNEVTRCIKKGQDLGYGNKVTIFY